MALPPLVEPSSPLSPREIERYARHVLIPDVGMEGQRRLKNARVLVVGAGGLGSPALMYLAAAGVGTIGVVDDDVVELSNLQRQVVHGVADVGRRKSESASQRLASVNPLVRVVRHDVRIHSANALEIIAGYDLVLDGTDNFPTRYLLNDACVLLGKPDVWGSIYRFDGQASIWWAKHGPCYRCVFPTPPPPGLVPSCAEGGVLGVLCAAIGSVQAAEAVKLIVGMGDPLVGRLMVHDALRPSWDLLTVHKNPDCAVCGESPTVTALVDYEDFCAVTPASGESMPDGSVAAAAAGAVPQISARELADLLAGEGAAPGVLLVDVRGGNERDIAGIPGAQAIHLDEFRSGEAVPKIPFDRPVVMVCKMGARSEEASRILLGAGHPDVRNLAGGVLAWVRDVDPAQPSY
jgi:sulfur-carrier protein adenylyltransferase/sulfurtransferase